MRFALSVLVSVSVSSSFASSCCALEQQKRPIQWKFHDPLLYSGSLKYEILPHARVFLTLNSRAMQWEMVAAMATVGLQRKRKCLLPGHGGGVATGCAQLSPSGWRAERPRNTADQRCDYLPHLTLLECCYCERESVVTSARGESKLRTLHCCSMPRKPTNRLRRFRLSVA